MLNLHPMVRMVSVEVHFFDKSDHFERGLDWYRSSSFRSRTSSERIEMADYSKGTVVTNHQRHYRPASIAVRKDARW